MTDTLRSRPAGDVGSRTNGSSSPTPAATGFRPSRRRRNRIAAGVALGAAAIGGNLMVYSSLNDSAPVVQVVRDVPAGVQLTGDMLRTVDADVDDSVNVVPGDQLGALVGRYARVRLGAGSLVTAESLQSVPLVDPAHAVVAIRVPEGSLPVGLRERVPVQLVLPAADDGSPPTSVVGEVVALPTTPDSVLGTQSLSIELAESDAAAVAASDDVRVVLLAPDLEAAGD